MSQEDFENNEDLVDETLEVFEDESVEEAVTDAAASIEPKGSKTEVMAVATKMISGMSGEDLNGFQKMMAQFGPNKDFGVPEGAAGKNAASISTKPSAASAMKEDIEAMFNGEELSEEFKTKATTLFEAAVNAKVTIEQTRLEEEYQNMLREELELFTEEVTEKLDTYLDYVVENWMKENEVAIESTLRNEISEEFIEDLRGLFEKNYMNIPEEKVDVIEQLASKVEELESTLHESISENKELKNALVDSYKEKIIEDVSSDLTLSQKEKFMPFAEGVEFDGDFDEYVQKLEIVKENYFISSKTFSSNIEEETYEGEDTLTENVSYSDPAIERYARALQRTVKR